jgi:hypothetical protein
MKLQPAAFAAALVLFASAAFAQPSTYPIQLTRPDKPDTTFDIHLTMTRSIARTITDSTTPGQLTIPQVEKLNGDLVGRMEIVKVNATGMPTLMNITVKSFTNTATQVQVVPEGTILTVTRGDKTNPTSAIIQGGGQLSKEASDLLAAWYEPDQQTPSDDATFGSKTPRAVGDAWKADLKSIVDGLHISGVDVKPEDIDALATLKAVDKAGSVPVMHVTMTIAAKNFRPIGTPDTVVIDDSQTKMTYDKTLPQDLAATTLQDNLAIDMQMKMHNGGKTISIESHAVSSGTYIPVKK